MAQRLLFSGVMRWAHVFLIVFALSVWGCSSEKDNSSPDANAGPLVDASGELLPFMSECTENSQCETNLCFQFNSKGPHCTHECTTADDCEAPSPGCNNKGVCKAP